MSYVVILESPVYRTRGGSESSIAAFSFSRQREMRLAIVPGGQVERLADRAVALVPGEEAVEDLPAVSGELLERSCGPPAPRRASRAASSTSLRLDVLLGDLAAAGAEAVDAASARQLRDPRPDRGVVAQPVELLVHLREDVLEDVLGVVRARERKPWTQIA